jgi:hypothetical protein
MMKLAFYKGGGPWARDFIGGLIKWWTHGQFSHVELVFNDGLSYSARAEDDRVSFKAIDYTRHPERWTMVSLEACRDIDESFIRKHAERHKGEKYDFVGICTDQVFHTHFHKEDAWWCSEICAHILGFEPELICPQELYDRITKAKTSDKISEVCSVRGLYPNFV